MKSTILFASDNLLVRHVSVGGPDLCYVTFASYTDERVLDRPGFGESFFRSRGVDAVHVLSRDNDWYQYPEWDDAVAAIAAAAAGYAQVVAYGSSMGGFAALHYGASCGAQLGIAISPQYSVDPEIAPFEDRWIDDVARIRFRRDETRPLPRQYIVYDPMDPNDRQHFELFAARSPTIGLRAMHGGHPAGTFILETQMFTPLFDGALTGAIDPAAYSAAMRARRRQSGQYLYTLSVRTAARRWRQKIALARMAADVSGEPLYISYLATLLDQAGELVEAARYHRLALRLSPDQLHIRHAWVLHHELAGRLDRAGALIEPLVREHPGLAFLTQTRRRIRRRQRQRHPGWRLLMKLKLDAVVDRVVLSARRGLRQRFDEGDPLTPANMERKKSNQCLGSATS
jgi:pimeloyl-ACP methyl ester carboxylesterase